MAHLMNRRMMIEMSALAMLAGLMAACKETPAPTSQPTSEPSATKYYTGTPTAAATANPSSTPSATASATPRPTDVPTQTPTTMVAKIINPTGHIDSLCDYYGHVTADVFKAKENANKMYIPFSCQSLEEPLYFSNMIVQDIPRSFISFVTGKNAILNAMFDGYVEFGDYTRTDMKLIYILKSKSGPELITYFTANGITHIVGNHSYVNKGDPIAQIAVTGQRIPDDFVSQYGLKQNATAFIIQNNSDLSESRLWLGADMDNKPKFMPEN